MDSASIWDLSVLPLLSRTRYSKTGMWVSIVTGVLRWTYNGQPGGKVSRVQNEQRPTHTEWQQAINALRRGEAVGFPTETVWGLGVDAHSEAAVRSLSRLKGRPIGKALQVCCGAVLEARALAAPGQALFGALCAYLPGPLTLVARAAADCPAWLSVDGLVGLRVPDHPLIQELLSRWGGPLATSSLNPAGLPSARTRREAESYHLAAVLLDAANLPAPLGQPSTVVDCVNARILREGAVPTIALHPLLEQFGQAAQ